MLAHRVTTLDWWPRHWITPCLPRQPPFGWVRCAELPHKIGERRRNPSLSRRNSAGSVRLMTASRVIQNFVDGKLVDSADGRRADLIDPSTGEVFGSTPVSGAEDVDRAYRGRGDRVRDLARHDAERTAAGAARIRRRPRGTRRRPRRRREPEHRQADRAHQERRDPADDRPGAVLRRRGPAARRPQRRGVHEPVSRPTSGASRWASSGRSRRGTTR